VTADAAPGRHSFLSEPPAENPARPPVRLTTSHAASWALKLGQWLLLALVLLLIGRVFRDQFAKVSWAELRFDPLLLALGGLCVLVVRALSFVLYELVIARLAHSPGWRVMMAATWISQAGKYLPGKVGAVVGMTWILLRHGVPGKATVSTLLIVDGLVVITGLLVAVPLTLWKPVAAYLPMAWLWFALLTVVGAVCLHPRVFGAVVNFVLRRFGYEPLRSLPRLRDYVAPAAVMFLQLLISGAGLWFVSLSLTDVAVTWLPLLVAICALVLVAGLIAFFAPAGLGIREGIFLAALSPVLGGANAAVAALIMRVLQTAAEMLLVLAGLLLMPRRPDGGRNP